MGMSTRELDVLVRKRIDATKEQRDRSRAAIYSGNPLEAEPNKTRAANVASRMGAEALQGDTIDYLPSWFLSLGASRAKAVAIVRTGTGSPLGTGFLISPRLLITNNHVLENELQAKSALIEFNFANDDQDLAMTTTRFALDPGAFWLANDTDKLDFSIIAVGEKLSGPGSLRDFGFFPLSDRPDKHALGLAVNIIQHPQGRRKQVVVRENRLLARDIESEHCLHYSADTEEGASGSPVLNDAWEVVALHHWGIPHLDKVSVNGVSIPVTVNEGIRTSVIVKQLRADMAGLAAPRADLLKEALDLGENVSGGMSAPNAPGAPRTGALHLGGEDLNKDKVVTSMNGEPANSGATQTVMIPLEVTVRLAGAAKTPSTAVANEIGSPRFPGLQYAEKITRDRNYGNRNGYDPHFIDGLSISLEDLVRPRATEVAPLLDGTSGETALLHYQNFSVLMCQDRRMAFVSAVNIDANKYIDIDRDTGQPQVGPEGDTWFDDDRMDPNHHLGQDFYGAWSSYFDRGHLTRRSDPTWGSKSQAVKANADTFHRTNCTPQHFRFNQSIKYWQGLERYILEFGVLKNKERVTVLTGPVLDEENVSTCDDVDVPLLFWKVVLRVGPNGAPQASAYVVSQEKLIQEPRTFVRQANSTNAPSIDTFRFSIPKLATLTGLDFSAIAPHDTFKKGPEGAEAATRPMTDWSDAL